MRLGIVGLAMLCLVLLQTSPVESDSAKDDNDIFPKLAGSWKGEGRAFGMSSRASMTWESALGGRFMKLTYRTELQPSKGDPQVFEGHAYYKSLGGGKYQGTWFDSQGEVHPIDATFDGTTLTSDWGTKTTKLGRTTYRLVKPDAMELVDYIQEKDGTWKQFSRAMLRKE